MLLVELRPHLHEYINELKMIMTKEIFCGMSTNSKFMIS